MDYATFLPMLALLLAIGAATGVIAGLLGVGGGIVLVPAFFYLFGQLGFAQQEGRCGLGYLNLVGAIFGVGRADWGGCGLFLVDHNAQGDLWLFGHGGRALHGLWSRRLAFGHADAHPTCARG